MYTEENIDRLYSIRKHFLSKLINFFFLLKMDTVFRSKSFSKFNRLIYKIIYILNCFKVKYNDYRY